MKSRKVYDVSGYAGFETVAPTEGGIGDLAEVGQRRKVKEKVERGGLEGNQLWQENILRFDKIPEYFGENGRTAKLQESGGVYL